MKTVLALAFGIFCTTYVYAQGLNTDGQLLFAPDKPAPPEQPCITLSNKKILCGQADKDGSQLLSVFKGVQYGQADRWQSANLFDEYMPNGYEALQYGARCPQPIAKPKDPIRGEENCLYLNIWAPAEAIKNLSKLPVMVFFHGGGFTSGGANKTYHTKDGKLIDLYAGKAFASDQNIVLVTVNYRLGVLGSLATSGPTGQEPANGGNYGLQDQQVALQWVQKHISSFGGDPTQVTVFGQSSGAMMVGLHMFSADSSKGLFRAGIMQSAAAAYQYRNKEEGRDLFHYYLKCLRAAISNLEAAECEVTAQLDDLEQATTRQILVAQGLLRKTVAKKALFRSALPGSILFSPIIDGNFLKAQPHVQLQKGSDMPLMLGVNKNEGVGLANRIDAAGKLNAVTFNAILGRDFENAKLIIDRPSYNVQTPAAHGLRPKTPATALSNLIGNFAFVCPNTSANIEAQKPNTSTWFYYFVQTSVANMQKPPTEPGINNTCGPHNEWDNSCHGSELPFVFNALPPEATQDDKDLAVKMNALWAQFAKTPGEGPSKDWKLWNWPETGNPANFNLLKGAANKETYDGLFERSDCTFWLGEIIEKNANAILIPKQLQLE
ncbi:Para-nitrobenzyl esterase [Pseudovibrio axinellae]|uniref:Carboxylic ester hydrolase n=1 Tax=Pseudovibrio axinellae TaxID=989403 RepID=A0A165U1Y6_9HYPH|nr:carboxylesterase family protein [Pseudovibrio axinellae]KZL09463.1 Para-nitrobenzyl esterase [Pseudovibrio axinellae]SEQ64098.1 acetylcholinesterase/para-nitrobenzyl esterase [Pseudovibrio axinellae]